MIKIIRIRKRRLLKKLFLFFTFSTPFSFNMQFPACALFVRKTLFCLSNPYHLITEKIVFHLFFLKMGTKRTVGGECQPFFYHNYFFKTYSLHNILFCNLHNLIKFFAQPFIFSFTCIANRKCFAY